MSLRERALQAKAQQISDEREWHMFVLIGTLKDVLELDRDEYELKNSTIFRKSWQAIPNEYPELSLYRESTGELKALYLCYEKISTGIIAKEKRVPVNSLAELGEVIEDIERSRENEKIYKRGC